jgi:hypothetical protein
LTVSQSVSLVVEPHLGLMTRYFLLFDSYGLCFSGAPSLTRGWVCLLCMLLALARLVFLGFESLGIRDHILLSQIWDFLFVASYDSQGHGRGIRTRLHTADELVKRSQSHIATDGQSTSKSWWPDIYYCLIVTVLFFWGALSDEKTGLSFVYAAGPRLVKVKVKVTLRLAVYRQSVCFGVKPLETHGQNFLFPTEPFRY